MTVTGIARDVRLGAYELRIASDAKGNMQYHEDVISGMTVYTEHTTKWFADEMTSWHKGAFVKENVQDGYYYLACNVDCTYPGRMFPGPKRDTNLNLPTPSVANGYGGVASISSMPWRSVAGTNTPINIVVSYEKKVGSTTPSDQLRVTEMDEVGTVSVNQTFALETNRFHFNYLRPVFLKKFWHVPALEAGYLRRDAAEPTPWTLKGNGASQSTSIPVWAFGAGTDKIYRAYYPSQGSIPQEQDDQLYFSTCSMDADETVIASWTQPGEPIPGVLSAHFEQVGICMIGRLPYIGTKSGVYTFGRNGWAESLFPQFQEAPSNSYDFKAYRNYNAMILAGTANAQVVMFTGSDAVPVGPMVNPAAQFTNDNAPTFLDFYPLSSGRVFGTVIDGSQIYIWEGVPRTPGESGPGVFAWHMLLCIQTVSSPNPPSQTEQDILTGDNFSMMRPLCVSNMALGWPYSGPKTWLWYGAGRADGRIFRWRLGDWGDLEAGKYPHEDANLLTGITWRSGRYDRGDKKTVKHWIQLAFDGENMASADPIRVQYSVDGGAFVHAGLITANHQSIPIDARGYDIELQLDWYRDATGAYVSGGANRISAPATIKRIIFEGREQPEKLTEIRFVAEGTLAQQTGKVRFKKQGVNTFNDIDALSRALKQTFRDPYGNNRTVAVLHPTNKDIISVTGDSPPRIHIRVNLLEVP